VAAYVEQTLEQVAPQINGRKSAAHVGTPDEEISDPFHEIREAILQTTCGVLLDDSVEEIRRMREERSLYLENLEQISPRRGRVAAR
jgi:hypothetical protein